MENCLSKFNDKPFTLHLRPLNSGHLKKLESGIWKNPVKDFATGVHQKYGYERFTQSIKSILIDIYDRFPPQSFELLDGGATESGSYNLVLSNPTSSKIAHQIKKEW